MDAELRTTIFRGRTLWLVTVLSALLFAPLQTLAHPLAPSLLELREQPGGDFALRWKTPILRARGADLEPVLPAVCRGIGQQSDSAQANYLMSSGRINCAPMGLEGQVIRVRGLKASRTAALVRIEFLDGEEISGMLESDDSEFRVERRGASGWSYLTLGFHHILSGPDHLLFVLGLLLLLVSRRKLLGAISAFTVGHSLTLAISVLGILQIPPQWVEVGIAISIVVVALELCAAPGTRASLLRDRPWLASFGFGLLHGMGFAGALRQAGLPSNALVEPLLFFNFGIELGQLSFIAAVSLAAMSLPSAWRAASWSTRGMGYLIGTLAVYWVFERGAAVI